MEPAGFRFAVYKWISGDVVLPYLHHWHETGYHQRSTTTTTFYSPMCRIEKQQERKKTYSEETQ